ncbi:hypothetical protein [Subtercola sp. YIM 133946]|uniref:hypothetical protein n=1 Tax=Subtercola sp. YIM 133946 TaxID=3118909 RepID=UPI002F94C97C
MIWRAWRATEPIRSLSLRTVLKIDAAHVTALTGLAVAARLSGRQTSSRTADGLLGCAIVAVLGFALAVIAVQATERRRDGRVSSSTWAGSTLPVKLIVVGGLINTLGSAGVVVVHRGDRLVTVTAAVLLLGGDVLTALYLTQLRGGGPSREGKPLNGERERGRITL